MYLTANPIGVVANGIWTPGATEFVQRTISMVDSYHRVVSAGSGVTTILAIASLALFAAIAFRSRKHSSVPIDYRQLFENASVGIYRAALDGQILTANSHLVRLLGFDSFEQLAASGTFPGQHQAGIKELVRGPGELRPLDLIWVKPDNSSIKLRITARLISARTELVEAYEGTVQDISEFRRSEEDLKRRLSSFQSLFDRAALPILVVDRGSGAILKANPNALSFFDYSESELSRLDLRELVIPIKQDGSSGEWLLAPKVDVVHRTRDGRAIRLQAVASGIDFDGKPATLCVFQDFGARIGSECEALSGSALDSLPQSIYCKNLEGEYTFANKSFRDWVRRPLAEIVGKSDVDFFPEGTARRLGLVDQGVVRSHEVADLVEEWQSPDGETVFSEMMRAPKYDPDGNVAGVIAMFWDITERRAAEEELQRERGFFDTLMDVIPDTIYFKDAETRFTKINVAQARVLGLAHPNDAIGKSDADFFNPDHAKRARADDLNVMKAGKPLLDLVEKNTGGDGNTRWFSSTKVPIIDKDGHAIGMVGISRNITERKVAEEAVERSMESFLKVVSAVSDGDLTQRGGEGDDTLGKISRAVNRMLASFCTMLDRVKQVGLSVSSSASQILSASQEIAVAAGKQADEVTNASSTVEEMAAAMAQVSRNAEASAEAARQALTIADSGQKSVSDTSEAMGRIRSAVQDTSAKMGLLAKRSLEISEIIDLINEIAAQTNLLSLNAAIEAAHAGEAGLGFSVVAEEIRKLAERSARATRDVAAIIRAIQSESAEALLAMDVGNREVQAGSQMAEQASLSLRNIFAVVKESSQLIEEISAASDEQARVTTHLATAMQAISATTMQTSAATQQAASTVRGLASLSEDLNQAISKFRVNDSIQTDGQHQPSFAE